MSDSPPKPGSGPGSTEATKETANATMEGAGQNAGSPVNIGSSALGALDDAAKAMDAVVVRSDVPAPAADAIVKDSATATSPAPEAPKPVVEVFQLPATTSGMHQQYVAPGVARQSFLSSNRFTVIFLGVMVAFSMYLLFAGGRDSFGIGGGASTPPTSTATSPLVDDPRAFPNPNNVVAPPPTPQADFTVNAAAIGATNPPTVGSATKKGDAGANKGGYADETADLAAAEAMVDKDPVKALQMVDQHDVDYPRGMLDPEARVIRVEAYAKKGDDVKALELGNEFLEDYPHSPGAGRVVAIVEALKNKLDSGHP